MRYGNFIISQFFYSIYNKINISSLLSYFINI